MICVNLPTMLAVVIPFALLPWGLSHVLWMLAIGTSFILAAYLMWSIGARDAPIASGVLIGLFLIGSEMLLEIGNPAGIAVSLCVIAVWCFLRGSLCAIGRSLPGAQRGVQAACCGPGLALLFIVRRYLSQACMADSGRDGRGYPAGSFVGLACCAALDGGVARQSSDGFRARQYRRSGPRRVLIQGLTAPSYQPTNRIQRVQG